MIIVVDLLYAPIIFSAKLSLFLLYYRLFSRHRWMRNLIYLGISIVGLTSLATMTVIGYLCLPRRGHGWIETLLSPRCQKQFVVTGFVRGPTNIFSDMYLLLLPLPAVQQLQLPPRKKIGIAGIFLTGFL